MRASNQVGKISTRERKPTDVAIRLRKNGHFLSRQDKNSPPLETLFPRYLPTAGVAILFVRVDLGLDESDFELVTRAELEARRE